jgi:aquaporin Z
MNASMKKVWLAEFIGTFCLVFFGCGSIIAAEKGFLSPSYAAWIFGLTVFMMIVFFGKISNAHFNPARTLGPALFSKNLDHLALYFIAPVIGSLVGAALIAQLRKSNS